MDELKNSYYGTEQNHKETEETKTATAEMEGNSCLISSNNNNGYNNVNIDGHNESGNVNVDGYNRYNNSNNNGCNAYSNADSNGYNRYSNINNNGYNAYNNVNANAETNGYNAYNNVNANGYNGCGNTMTDGNNGANNSNNYWNGNFSSNTDNGYFAGSYGPAGYGSGNGCQNNMFRNDEYSQLPPLPPKKKSGAMRKFLSLVAAALVFGVISGGAFLGVNRIYENLNPTKAVESAVNASSGETTQIQATTVLSTGNVTSTDVSDLVENAMPSVVSINGTFTNSSWFGQYETTGSGSGIIVGENDTELLIVTNNHVVENAKSVTAVLIDGTEVSASIKGTDATADLAVIAVKLSDLTDETKAAISCATLGNSDDVRVGEMVVAIGNALGYGQSVTVGYISAKNREVTVDDTTMILLQTDAAINPGNSGGALLNMNGEVIGINSVKYASDEVEGMGFAIPISNVTGIIEVLMNKLSAEEKGYLGVYVNEVTADVAEYYNWPVGVYVVEFTENSAAKEAGIQIADIITGINGVAVVTADEMIEMVTSNPYGTEITVTLQRNIDGVFTEVDLSVVLRQSSAYSTEETVPTVTETPTLPEDHSPRR